MQALEALKEMKATGVSEVVEARRCPQHMFRGNQKLIRETCWRVMGSSGIDRWETGVAPWVERCVWHIQCSEGVYGVHASGFGHGVEGAEKLFVGISRFPSTEENGLAFVCSSLSWQPCRCL